MELQAEAKVFFVEPSTAAASGVREQIESTAQAMAPSTMPSSGRRSTASIGNDGGSSGR